MNIKQAFKMGFGTLLTLGALHFVGCIQQENFVAAGPANSPTQDEGVTFVTEEGTFEFSSVAEMQEYVSGKVKYASVEQKLSAFQDQQEYIVANNLMEREDGVEMLSKYQETSLAKSAVAAYGWLYKDDNGNGGMIAWLGSVNPSLRKTNRNKASSILVVGGVMLCDQTWYRGKKIFINGLTGAPTKNLSDYGFNDRTESTF